MKIIDESLLNKVSAQAKELPRLRMNYNFHQSLNDKCHRFLNAVEPGTMVEILFLDQPSQIYFPSDSSELAKCKDIEAVKRMFNFILDRTDEMEGEFQVIMTEHANIQDEEFQHNVIQEWYDGEKLIPEDWYIVEPKES